VDWIDLTQDGDK